jgi:DNA repair photolyase
MMVKAKLKRMPLFELGARKPTTREIALTVKSGGTAALTGADLRADSARYQEVRCRSALNRVLGMPFHWTLNSYRGCTHGCHYCFARRYHTQFEMNTGDEFASVILVKTNSVEILVRELDRPSWKRDLVAVGTATDPYQPIEGHYRLTRGALEAFARARTPVGIVTKGPMVVRDRDVLQDLARAARCTVYMSVPTVDEDAWRTLEPGTAHPLQRLRAVRELTDAGINAGVLMAPIVPGFTSARAKLERTVKAIADHGARFVGSNVMHLEDGTRAHFLNFVSREFPSMRPRFERLYAGKHVPAAYRKEVKAMVRVLQNRYGLSKREEAGAGPSETPEAGPEQVGFAW